MAHKTWNYMILEYILKEKAMKEVVSKIYIFTTSSTQEIVSQNNFQVRFLDNFRLKQKC